jgi:hypothetical protein
MLVSVEGFEYNPANEINPQAIVRVTLQHRPIE